MTEELPQLGIGDAWNAIRLTARTQGKPLKAMAELIENSIDAHAQKILVDKKHGTWHVWDDGDGFPLDKEGLPNFRYMITHIFDSIKKKMDEQERRGIQGEFGIGFLGFWSLAKQAKVVTRAKSSPTRAVLFKKDVRQPEAVRAKERSLPGTEVILSELTREGKRLKCDRLAKFLAEELRDRIKETGVQIVVRNKAARKEIEVKPREFIGDRITEVARIMTESGKFVRAEIYIAFPKEGESVSVAVCRRGTRLIKSICELDEFDCYPWNSNRLDGLVDFSALSVPPGTREGIVRDDAYEVFVGAMKSIEPKIAKRVREYEKAAEEKASKEIMAEVQKAFDQAWDKLGDDFDWFDSGRGKGPGRAERRGLGKAKPGMLEGVKISPTVTSVLKGEEKFLTARALDSQGKPITGVSFSWSVDGRLGTVKAFINRAAFVAGNTTGEETVRVVARQGGITREATATVLVSDTAAKREPPRGDRGLPPYVLDEWPPGARSRWDESLGTVYVNTAHWDWRQSQHPKRTKRLYIAKMYAQQLVLLNRQGESAENVLESMLDVVGRLEPSLRGKGRP